MYDTFGKWWHL